MNYIKELNAFRDWLLLNDLPTGAIALWHTLMSINNMAGWKERFNAPNSTIEKLTGLSKQGLVDARKRLLENQLIEYEKGSKTKAPIYKMCSLVKNMNEKLDQSAYQSEYQSAYQSNDQDLTIPKQKLNETKQDDDKARAMNPFRFFEQEGFGTLSSFVGEQLGDLVDAHGEDRVLSAMKEAVLNGARNLKYVRAILNNPNSSKPKGARAFGTHKPNPPKTNDVSGLDW